MDPIFGQSFKNLGQSIDHLETGNMNKLHFTCWVALLLAALAAIAGCVTTYDAKTSGPPPAGDRWLLLHELRETIADKYSFQEDLAPRFGISGYIGPDRNNNGSYDCPYSLNTQPVATSSPAGEKVMVECRDGRRMTFTWDATITARKFARTLHALAISPPDNETDASFTETAARYRALSEKPALPESIRAFKVGAENAVREKRPADAVNQYRKGLQSYPTWPQARFNLALLYAELNIPEGAIAEMEKYLLLVPEAANARQAQDKIYEWKAKLVAP